MTASPSKLGSVWLCVDWKIAFFFCCCTVVRHTNHLPVWVQKYTERMSCGSWRLELKAISSGRVGNDGIIITSNTSPKSIFKDENYRGGWVHDKARRRSLGAFSGSEVDSLSLQRLTERPSRSRSRRTRRRSSSKRVSWSAETGRVKQSAGVWLWCCWCC